MAADILQLLGIRSFRTAVVLLGGLLAYDAFWWVAVTRVAPHGAWARGSEEAGGEYPVGWDQLCRDFGRQQRLRCVRSGHRGRSAHHSPIVASRSAGACTVRGRKLCLVQLLRPPLQLLCCRSGHAMGAQRLAAAD